MKIDKTTKWHYCTKCYHVNTARSVGSNQICKHCGELNSFEETKPGRLLHVVRNTDEKARA